MVVCGNHTTASNLIQFRGLQNLIRVYTRVMTPILRRSLDDLCESGKLKERARIFGIIDARIKTAREAAERLDCSSQVPNALIALREEIEGND